MTISKWTAAGGLAIALLVGLLFGRFATPSKLIESEKLVSFDRDTELSWHAYVGRTESKIETKTNWQTVTKWLPGGTVVQTVAVAKDHTSDTHTDVVENDGKVKEVVKYVDVEKIKIVESKKPDWLIGVQAGLRLDGWRPIYGGAVARRIIGPVFMGMWGQAAGASLDGAAAGLGVTVLF